MCAATLLFEGTDKEIKMQEQAVMAVCKEYGGIVRRRKWNSWIFFDYVIAYLRDYGFDF